jgi:hypothetical protein
VRAIWVWVALLFCVSLPESAARPANDDVIEFDRDFLDRLPLTGYVHARAIEVAIPEGEPAPDGRKRGIEDRVRVFIEVLKYFVSYANQFGREQDEVFATVGDFRATYIHRISEEFPNVYWHVDAYRMTSNFDGTRLRSEGGGAGVQVELKPLENGTLSLSVLPLYGEVRSFSSTHSKGPSGSDFIPRANVAAGYRHKVSEYFEPGFLVHFQPQYINFGEFRVYAESFARLRIIHNADGTGSAFQIREVSLVPKVVYWYSTDTGGIFGDPISRNFGESYYRLNSHLYGFLNLEFHFRM